jgi:transposase
LLREVKETGEANNTFQKTSFAKKLRRWCKDALCLKDQCRDKKVNKTEYKRKTARLETRLAALAETVDPDPDAQRLTKRLQRHQSELTRFLHEPKLEGTNNRAERALRPAVVFRKITGGNRSEAAATAWAKLASLMTTADQQKLGVYEATKKLIAEYWETARR